ncbi:MAG: DUF899 family protein [Roseiflexaceae bacterium]|nr:DUF899 family protein [Roseiflexaceae bacterium]
MNLSTVVSRDEWRTAHQGLLANEKAATCVYEALNTERRNLPMIKVEQEGAF